MKALIPIGIGFIIGCMLLMIFSSKDNFIEGYHYGKSTDIKSDFKELELIIRYRERGLVYNELSAKANRDKDTTRELMYRDSALKYLQLATKR